MKVLLTTTAAAGFLALTLPAAPALAEGNGNGCFTWYGTTYCPETPEEECVECLDDAINIQQIVSGFQKAFNNITDVDDVTDATQTAVNAANLISLDGIDVSIDDIGEVSQTADPYLFQMADNDIYAGVFSALYNISQSASNVVNVFSGPEVNEITQDADSTQWAFNTIEYGKGGYDADALYDGEELLATQAALNAANLITVGHLTGSATQMSDVEQKAINTMSFAGDGHYVPYWVDIEVWDVGQTATNVANVFSATTIDGVDCGCVSVFQDADTFQFALNDLSGSGWHTDMSNIVQEATNIANSVSYLTPEE